MLGQRHHRHQPRRGHEIRVIEASAPHQPHVRASHPDPRRRTRSQHRTRPGRRQVVPARPAPALGQLSLPRRPAQPAGPPARTQRAATGRQPPHALRHGRGSRGAPGHLWSWSIPSRTPTPPKRCSWTTPPTGERAASGTARLVNVQEAVLRHLFADRAFSLTVASAAVRGQRAWAGPAVSCGAGRAGLRQRGPAAGPQAARLPVRRRPGSGRLAARCWPPGLRPAR